MKFSIRSILIMGFVFALLFMGWQFAELTKHFVYLHESEQPNGDGKVLMAVEPDGFSPMSDPCDAQIYLWVSDSFPNQSENFSTYKAQSSCEFAGLTWSHDGSVVGFRRRATKGFDQFWCAYDFRAHRWIETLTNGDKKYSQKIAHLLKKRGGAGQRINHLREGYGEDESWLKQSRFLNWWQSIALEKSMRAY